MLLWNNAKYFTLWTESRPEILFFRLLMFQRDEYLGWKKPEIPMEKGHGCILGCLTQIPAQPITSFFSLSFSQKGISFLSRPLSGTFPWESLGTIKLPGQKWRRTEMESRNNALAFMSFVGEFGERRRNLLLVFFFFFSHVSARWSFSKCRHIRESASKRECPLCCSSFLQESTDHSRVR